MNEITPTPAEGEARIFDLDLARRLGFAFPLNIRNRINRHEGALQAWGVLLKIKKTCGPARRAAN